MRFLRPDPRSPVSHSVLFRRRVSSIVRITRDRVICSPSTTYESCSSRHGGGVVCAPRFAEDRLAKTGTGPGCAQGRRSRRGRLPGRNDPCATDAVVAARWLSGSILADPSAAAPGGRLRAGGLWPGRRRSAGLFHPSVRPTADLCRAPRQRQQARPAATARGAMRGPSARCRAASTRSYCWGSGFEPPSPAFHTRALPIKLPAAPTDRRLVGPGLFAASLGMPTGSSTPGSCRSIRTLP